MPAENPGRSRRLRKRVEVRYGLDGPQHTGYTGNISRTGIMIRAIRVYGPGTVLTLELRFPDRPIVVKAQVAWAREGTVQLLPTGRVGMGLKFVDPPPSLLQLLAEGGSV